jgi:hypothetical protein
MYLPIAGGCLARMQGTNPLQAFFRLESLILQDYIGETKRAKLARAPF